MRIEKLILENFRLITDLNINPSAINLIVGKNNSGKSSLVEAIYFAFYMEVIYYLLLFPTGM